MNINAFLPLIVSIAYLPLLATILGMRPWRRQTTLFVFFIVASVVWSLVDYVSISNFFPQANLILFKLLIVIFVWMAIQFYSFTSSFFPPDKPRWLPLAYGSLLLDIVLVGSGYFPQTIEIRGGSLYPIFGYTTVLVVLPLFILLVRNVYILLPRLKNQKNPIIVNQTLSLVMSTFIITFFVGLSISPLGKVLPVNHIGTILSAFILTYTVVARDSLDVRLIIRRSLIWLSVGVVGIACFLGLLLAFGAALNVSMNTGTMLVASLAGIMIFILVYKLQDLFSQAMGKIFQGESYYYRQKLLDFANQIHNMFSLKDQGGELLALLTRSVGCKKAGLLFLDASTDDFEVQLVHPAEKTNSLLNLKLRRQNPIVEYLRRERSPLTNNTLNVLPEFLSLWQQEKSIIDANEIELFMPLISRDRLIGILVLDKKQGGRYTVEDFAILEDVTSRVAVSMEKEYLREKLKEREEELSIINRSSAIITSSLDIQRIYDNFIAELKRIVDVDWAAIAVVEEAEVYFMALSSDVGSPWKVGERVPLKGSATEWAATHRTAIVESDLSRETHFGTGKYFLQHNLRSIVYQPLIISNEVIGTLIVASQKPNVYNQRHLKLLEQLSAQIAMPIENARVYAKTERMARVDELTGLLNRRSLDEVLPSEIGRHLRYGGVFSLIIVDLDSLKVVNDSYGHLAGDELLRKIGNVMKRAIREADQAFRYGGDEFAILLPQTSAEVALKVAERVRLQAASEINYGSTRLTISLGIASWPVDGISQNDLIAAADSALYEAKHRGGNCSQMAGAVNACAKNKTNNNGESEDSWAISTIFAMAETVGSRDHFSRNHSKKVHDLAITLAQKLGLSQLEINHLGNCALLHDVGKIGIGDEILNKRGNLSDADWEALKSHSYLGAAIVRHSSQLAPCAPGILHVHENYDGKGYPDRLKGEQIPLQSRILAIADAFASMTSERAYSPQLTYKQAIEELQKGSGTQFDPDLVKIFIQAVEKVGLPVGEPI
jgi:diguanylate cyclase (GGDEF)-like protein